ncbi:MAG: hypothetical protein MUO26_06615 [Methanotrichaceae archaeon]|nr:hypothetical protein [Methanotrichaceae archaeon]
MQRLNCERYPCHFPDQDCSFCFCPFYPCMDERTNGRMDEEAWSCQDCKVIHRHVVVDKVMRSLMIDENLSMAWRKVQRWR